MKIEEDAWKAALSFLARCLYENHPSDLKRLLKLFQIARDATWQESRESLANAMESQEDPPDWDTKDADQWCGRSVLISKEEYEKAT